MRFNAKKCCIMIINSGSNHFYQLENHIVQQVPDYSYLGVTLPKDLKWSSHINKLKFSNATLFTIVKILASSEARNRDHYMSRLALNPMRRVSVMNARSVTITVGINRTICKHTHLRRAERSKTF